MTSLFYSKAGGLGRHKARITSHWVLWTQTTLSSRTTYDVVRDHWSALNPGGLGPYAVALSGLGPHELELCGLGPHLLESTSDRCSGILIGLYVTNTPCAHSLSDARP